MAIVAFDGVSVGDLTVPCEMLARARDASGQRLYEVRVCSEHERIATEHFSVEPRFRLASLRRAHTVVVPGLSELSTAVAPAVVRAIARAGARGARVASICTGAFVLAATGLLDGLRATTHWKAAAELARQYPGIEVDPAVLYVDNGHVLTSAGAAAGLDLCLHLIREDFGAGVAAEVARAAVTPLERAGGQAQFISHEPPAADGASLGPLLVWLERNLARVDSVEAIARRAAMSSRTLHRRFREQTGTTPAQWLVRARVRRAQQLLEQSGRSVEEIAGQVGFASAVTMRARFTTIAGTSPNAYRRTFRRAPR
ncbi:MAG: helix-turn-helix domain-containing protein [Myxococcota bacterium]